MSQSTTVMAERLTVGIAGQVLCEEFSAEFELGDFVVVVGPNGAGKSTLGRVLAGRQRPLAGRLELLGSTVGKTDMRALAARIGLVSAELGREVEQRERVVDIVALGKHGGLRSAWFDLGDKEQGEAMDLLDVVGLRAKAEAHFGSLSSGERERVLVARGFMGGPRLMIFDEPTSHLDLAGREDVLDALGTLRLRETVRPTVVMITHHIEEIPHFATHALVLGHQEFTVGPVATTLTGAVLSRIFGRPIELIRHRGRYSALVHPSEGLGESIEDHCR